VKQLFELFFKKIFHIKINNIADQTSPGRK